MKNSDAESFWKNAGIPMKMTNLRYTDSNRNKMVLEPRLNYNSE